MRLNTKSIIYGTFVLTGANFLVRILGFIYQIFLGRAIGAHGIGLVQLISPINMIAITITVSGISVAVSRMIAQRKALGDGHGIRRIVVIAIILIILLFLCISIFILSNIDYITLNLLKDSRTRSAIIIFLPCILICSLGAIFKGFFYGTKDVHPSALSEIIEQITRIMLVSIILFNFRNLKIEIAVSIVIFGNVIGELASLLYLHYRYGKKKKLISYKSLKTLSNMILFKQMMMIAIPITITRLITSIINATNSILIPQRLIVSGLANNSAIALFGVISGMVMPLIFMPFTIINALSVIIIPNLSESIALNDWKNIRKKVSMSIFITCITAFASMGILIPLGKPISLILYRQPEVGEFLIPMTFSIIFRCMQHSLSSILNGLGKQNQAAFHFIISNVIQLGFTYYLVANPNFRIYGFIIGFIASTIVGCLLNLIVVIYTTKLHFKLHEWFIKPGLAALFMGLIINLIYSLSTNNGIASHWALLTALICGLIIFAITLLALGCVPKTVIKQLKTRLYL